MAKDYIDLSDFVRHVTDELRIRDALKRLGEMKFCRSCGHEDPVRCMQEILKPGFYSDELWIDAGCPEKCGCACHL